LLYLSPRSVEAERQRGSGSAGREPEPSPHVQDVEPFRREMMLDEKSRIA
jgi:hypothetical protein